MSNDIPDRIWVYRSWDYSEQGRLKRGTWYPINAGVDAEEYVRADNIRTLIKERNEARKEVVLLSLNETQLAGLQKYTDEELMRELVRRNGIVDAPTSRTMHLHEVLLGIGKYNHCYLTFTDLDDVVALMGDSHD